jgi:hypothetical protein
VKGQLHGPAAVPQEITAVSIKTGVVVGPTAGNLINNNNNNNNNNNRNI